MLCHTSLFIFVPMSHVTLYNILTSLSTVFIKGSCWILQLLKWLCRTLFFTHVEPITYGTLRSPRLDGSNQSLEWSQTIHGLDNLTLFNFSLNFSQYHCQVVLEHL